MGTLDAAERAQVETMMVVDQAFAALVQAWEFRLGSLNQMVGLVEPRPELWQRIKAEIARSRPAAAVVEAPAIEAQPAIAPPVIAAPPEPPAPKIPPVIADAAKAEPPKRETPIADVPETEPPKVEPPKVEPPKIEPSRIEPTAVEPKKPEAPPIEITRSEAAGAPPVGTPRRIVSAVPEGANDNANVVRLSSKVRQWRAVANVMTAAAAALLALVGVQLYRPDLLPQRLQPKPQIQTVQVKVPAAPEPAAQFVALLQKDAASPAFILTVDSATRSYTVRRVGAAPEPGKSFELW
ncbi:hypothetical protein, partial [Bradyrhizobium sp. STM 3809]|uniref:anti-sigma factor domain-containing protein n=1 Tax=Bradyrhizobium sp. STM 3809 TaxID=551936 RepID=UPI001F0B589A